MVIVLRFFEEEKMKLQHLQELKLEKLKEKN